MSAEEPKNVTQIIDGVKEEMCDNYCKYTEQIESAEEKGSDAAYFAAIDRYCETCPLNRL